MKGFLLASQASLRKGESLRRMALAGTELHYLLRRSERRSLALLVDRRGARVAAPRRATLAEIEAFVRLHADWLATRLSALGEAPQPAVLPLAEGSSLQFLGAPLRLRFAGEGRRVRWTTGGDGVDELWLPSLADPLAGFERALRARALEWFGGRVEEYCLRLGVTPPPVALGSARTRWGSCSQRSGIRLHWRLSLLPPALAEYVVAHEVAHLREMNHSPRFWALVSQLCPDWPALRLRLREEGARMPELVLAARSSPQPTETS